MPRPAKYSRPTHDVFPLHLHQHRKKQAVIQKKEKILVSSFMSVSVQKLRTVSFLMQEFKLATRHNDSSICPHQSSFCWICLPLLTLSIIRSSCPPSHHWISLGFHFAGLNPISLVGLSGWPGEGRYPKHINWSLGFSRDRFLDPSSSPHTLHHWLPSYRHMASPTTSMLMTHSSISHFDQMIQR